MFIIEAATSVLMLVAECARAVQWALVYFFSPRILVAEHDEASFYCGSLSVAFLADVVQFVTNTVTGNVTPDACVYLVGGAALLEAAKRRLDNTLDRATFDSLSVAWRCTGAMAGFMALMSSK